MKDKSLFNFPENYQFRTNNDSLEKVFRYTGHTAIQFSELEYFPTIHMDNSLNLKGKDISITIGEKTKKKVKGNHVGMISITEEDVWLEIAYEEKQFDQLLDYIDLNGIKNNLIFNASISQNEAKKKTDKNYDYYLVESFVINHNIFKK